MHYYFLKQFHTHALWILVAKVKSICL